MARNTICITAAVLCVLGVAYVVNPSKPGATELSTSGLSTQLQGVAAPGHSHPTGLNPTTPAVNLTNLARTNPFRATPPASNWNGGPQSAQRLPATTRGLSLDTPGPQPKFVANSTFNQANGPDGFRQPMGQLVNSLERLPPTHAPSPEGLTSDPIEAADPGETVYDSRANDLGMNDSDMLSFSGDNTRDNDKLDFARSDENENNRHELEPLALEMQPDGTYPEIPVTPVMTTGAVASNPDEHRFIGIRDFGQPLEAEPGWVVDEHEATVPREALLSIDIPRHAAARTRAMLDEATRLADRGALYAAREQFLRVLRVTCQSLDTQLGRPIHARALARGLKALEEAEDFALTENSPESDIHLRGFIEGHRTPVLKTANANELTALMAMQRYYKYAFDQLALAGNNEQIASEGLFALGRIESLMVDQDFNVRGGGPKALALYHASLVVSSQNSRAANELGVMLAKRGRGDDALGVLQHAARINPNESVMANLAIVHQRMSDPVAAQVAFERAGQIASGKNVSGKNVQWVTPAEFVAVSDGDTLQPIPSNQQPPKADQPEQRRRPVRTATRPGGTWDF